MIDEIGSYFYKHWGDLGSTIFVFLGIIFAVIVCAVFMRLMVQLEKFVKFLWHTKVVVENRSVRVFSVPLVALVAVSIGAAYIDYKATHSDTRGLKMVIFAIVITLVWSLITCHLKGLWVGPVRILLGILVFIAIATVVFMVIGFAAIILGLMGGSSPSPETITIWRNGRYVHLKRVSNSEYIDTSTNEQYTYNGSSVEDSSGVRYNISN